MVPLIMERTIVTLAMIAAWVVLMITGHGAEAAPVMGPLLGLAGAAWFAGHAASQGQQGQKQGQPDQASKSQPGAFE